MNMHVLQLTIGGNDEKYDAGINMDEDTEMFVAFCFLHPEI